MPRIHSYEQQSAAEADRVELMVHGVGGATPESMLDTVDIAQVRGDVTAGFFRLKQPSDGHGYLQEAYSWGGLTSRSASRAFWVLLAPFALLNVAGWMLPDGTDHPRRHAVATGLLRLVGFLVTVHAILWIGQMTIDFAAWQCGGDASCRSTTWLISLFGSGWFEGAPGRRLVAGALVPLIAIGVLAWHTRRTQDRYESVTPDALEDYGVEHTAPENQDTFSDPTFWRRGESLRTFAALHLAGAAAALAWLLAWTFAWLQPTGTPWTHLVLGWLALGLLIAAAVGVWVGGDPQPITDGAQNVVNRRLVGWHGWATTAVVLLTLASGMVWGGYEDPGRRLPLDPYSDAWFWIWAVSVLAVGLFVVVVLSHPARRAAVASPFADSGGSHELEVGFRSLGAIVAVLFGFLVMIVMLAGFGSATARLFGGRPVIQSTYLYDAFGLIATAWLGALVATLLARWFLRTSVPVDVIEDEVAAGFAEDTQSFFTGPKRKRRWLLSIRRARDIRAFIPIGESTFGGFVIGASVIAVGLMVVQRFAAEVVVNAVEWFGSPVLTATAWLVGVGIPLGMIWAVRSAYGSRQARKSIGALWDVSTFWPRWFHPLGPPSYCGRAIPELRTRLDTLVRSTVSEEGGAFVVITAHSQGSVIALAALDGLKDQEWFGHLSLLTHGSPITRMYVRYFPAHLSRPIERVFESLDEERWVNLYRLTDPIGGAISGETTPDPPGAWRPGSGHPLARHRPDVAITSTSPLPDPDLRLFAEPGDDGSPRYPKKGDPYPPAVGHSDYGRTPEYVATVRSLFGLMG